MFTWTRTRNTFPPLYTAGLRIDLLYSNHDFHQHRPRGRLDGTLSRTLLLRLPSLRHHFNQATDPMPNQLRTFALQPDQK